MILYGQSKAAQPIQIGKYGETQLGKYSTTTTYYSTRENHNPGSSSNQSKEETGTHTTNL